MTILNSLNVTPGALDNDAWTIFIVGILIVFGSLLLLSLLFNLIPKLIYMKVSFKRKPKTTDEVTDVNEVISGVENAAIAMALYLYFNEMHDDESGVLTIKQANPVSAWNSKLNVINNLNRNA